MMKVIPGLWIAVICVVFCLPVETSAGTINVPADYETIAGALAAADAGDTVLVQEGDYDEGPLEIRPGVTLLAAGRRDETVVELDGAVLFSAGQDSLPSLIKGFTLWLPDPVAIPRAIDVWNPGSGIVSNAFIDTESQATGAVIHAWAAVHIEDNVFSSARVWGIHLDRNVSTILRHLPFEFSDDLTLSPPSR